MNIELHLDKGRGIMQFSKEKFLPNGFIVLLKGGTKKVVIYGRKQLLMVEEPV